MATKDKADGTTTAPTVDTQGARDAAAADAARRLLDEDPETTADARDGEERPVVQGVDAAAAGSALFAARAEGGLTAAASEDAATSEGPRTGDGEAEPSRTQTSSTRSDVAARDHLVEPTIVAPAPQSASAIGAAPRPSTAEQLFVALSDSARGATATEDAAASGGSEIGAETPAAAEAGAEATPSSAAAVVDIATAGGADTITGGAGDDTLTGGAGDDIIDGAGGNDTIDGGGGNDVAVFSGNYAAYSIAYDGATQTFTLTGPDGVDTVTNVETFRFDDQDVTASALQNAADQTVNGASGDDTLTGGTGDDVITGGGGDNLVVFTDNSDSTGKQIRARFVDGDGAPVGAEIVLQAPSASTNYEEPTVTSMPDGRFLVTFTENPGTNLVQTYFQIVNSDGSTAFGAPVAVHEAPIDPANSWTYVDKPAVLSDGSFVVSWTEEVGGEHHVRFQHFNADGTKNGAPVEASFGDPDFKYGHNVVDLGDGDFGVLWAEANTLGSGYATDLYVQTFEVQSSGAPTSAGSPVKISGAMGDTLSAHRPDLVKLADGNVLAVWQSADQTSFSGWSGYFRLLDNDMNPAGPITPTGTEAATSDYRLDAIALENGGFVIGHSAWINSANTAMIEVQVFDAAGAPVGSPFQPDPVSDPHTTRSQNEVELTATETGFQVVWVDYGAAADGSLSAVQLANYDFNGNQVGPIQTVNATTSGYQWSPEIASGAASGDDTITGGGGDDTIDGGAGVDVAVFSGQWSDYTITTDGAPTPTYTIVDNRAGSPDGTDTVTNVETFRFNDGDVAAGDALNAAPTSVALSSSPIAENASGAVAGALSASDADGARDSHTFQVATTTTVAAAVEADPSTPVTVDYNGNDNGKGGTGLSITSLGRTDGGTGDYVFRLRNSNDTPQDVVVHQHSGGIMTSYTLPANSETFVTGISGGAYRLLKDGVLIDTKSGGNYAFTQDQVIDLPSKFEVVDVGGTPTLQLKAGESLDYETDGATVSVDVITTDAHGATHRETLTVSVADVAEDLVVTGDFTDTGVAETSITGDGSDQSITGSGAADQINGGAGDDTITGAGGDDAIDGGAGTGDVAVFSGNYAAYSVAYDGATQTFTLIGPDGTDTVTNVETFRFDDQDVTASALQSAAVQTLAGTSSGDALTGGTGDDTIDGGGGNDTIDGGGGNDVAVFSGNYAAYGVAYDSVTQTFTLTGPDGVDTVTNVETFRFDDQDVTASALQGAADQTLTGAGGGETLTGGTGDDTIDGAGGNDAIDGGAGTGDVAVFSGNYAAYSVAYNGATQTFTLTGPDGTDTVTNVETFRFDDQDVAASALQNAADQTLTGTSGDDTLTGGTGSDTITGAGGNDTITGGAGNDVIDGGAGTADVAVLTGTAGDYVFAFDETTQELVATDIDMTDGDDGVDRLIGIEGIDFEGVGYQDVFLGGAGDDVVDAGARDVAAGNGLSSWNQVFTGAGVDVITGSDTSDFIDAGSGNDQITAGQGSDVITGGAGDDVIDGGAGGGADSAMFSGNYAAYSVTYDGATQTFTLTGPDGVDTVTNVESFVFADQAVTASALQAAADQTLTGTSGGETLSGGTGDDTITGAGGNDAIDGGGGTGDVAIFSGNYAAYSVAYDGATQTFTLTGPDGTDTVTNVETFRFDDQDVTASALQAAADQTLTGTSSGETLTGGTGDDTITGAGGNDAIDGGGGNDVAVFSGNYAAYSVAYDGATQTFTLTGPDGTDTVTNVETFRFDDQDVTASVLQNAADQTLTGAIGDDTLTGGTGNDTISGDGGQTVVYQTDFANAGVDWSGADVATETVNGSLALGVYNSNNAAGELASVTASGLSNGQALEIAFDYYEIDSVDSGEGGRFYIDGALAFEIDNDGVVSNVDSALASNIQVTFVSSGDYAGNVYGTGSPHADRSYTVTFDTTASGATMQFGMGHDFSGDDEGVAIDNLVIRTEGGNDTIDGGAGNDVAIFSGDYAAYSVAYNVATQTFTLTGPDGTDTVTNVETFRFDDQDVTASALQAAADQTIVGTSGDDTLTGGTSDDTITGAGGNDAIDGGGGSGDVAVFSGNYADYAVSYDSSTQTFILAGPDGTDTVTNVESFQFDDQTVSQSALTAAAGQVISGGGGYDTINGTAGDDRISGFTGDDTINGLGGDDWLSGGEGGDTLRGGDDNDTLIGGGDNDTLEGGSGDDVFLVEGDDGAADSFDGGSGTDIIREDGLDGGLIFNGGASFTSIEAIEVGNGFGVSGGSGYDSLDFTGVGEIRQADGSAAVIDLGDGNDSVIGSSGSDIIHGGDGGDTITGGAGNDVIDGGALTDTAVFSGNYAAYSVAYNVATQTFTLTGPDGTDTVTNVETFRFDDQDVSASALQAAADQTIVGTSGGETLTGGTGDDTITGAGGNDAIDGGGGTSDVAIFSGNYAAYSVAYDGATQTFTLTGPDGTDTVTNVETFRFDDQDVTANALQNAADQTIVGTSGDDTLTGGAGNDALTGGAGDDRLIGGGENDNAPSDAASYSAAVNSHAPVGVWTLGEPSGAPQDSTSAGNNGVLRGDAALGAPGPFDGVTGVALDGSGDYVEIADNSAYQLNEGTVAIWFEVNGFGSNQALLSRDAAGYGGGGHLAIWVQSDGSIRVRHQNDAGGDVDLYSSPGLVTANSWSQVAYSWSSSGLELFLDGQSVATSSTARTIAGNNEPWTLGGSQMHSSAGTADSVVDTFGGTLAEFSIMSEALTASEAQALFDAADALGGDRAVFAGDKADFAMSFDTTTGEWSITDNDAADGLDEGTDTLVDIEEIAFADDVVTFDQAIADLFTGEIAGASGDDTLSGTSGNDVMLGFDGSDEFDVVASQGDDYVNGGAGSSWTDVLDIQGAAGSGAVSTVGASTTIGDWTVVLQKGSVDGSTGDAVAGSLDLSDDSSGYVEFADGDRIVFDNLESITWGA